MPWSLFWTIVVQVLIGTFTVCLCYAMISAAFKPKPKPDGEKPDQPGAAEGNPLAALLRARTKRDKPVREGTEDVPVAR